MVVTNEDIAKLFKEYVPRSYAAALKSKKINPKSQYRFQKDGSGWVSGAAPMNHIWDKPSVVSVYNQFLKSMTWGGKKPKNSPKSPASYFWGWNRPLDFSGSHNVIPMVYGSDTVMLHNYKTGKVAVVTDCEGDDDEAGEYAMSTVAFEWKMNPKLVAAMKTTTKAKAKPKAKPKPKAKASAKKPKYYLHFGEDFTADKCVYTGKEFAMTTIRSAKALANHMYSFGPMPNMTPGYADFTINGEHYGNIVTWETEIIDANTGEVVDYWTPSKEQKAAYRKKANAIKKAAKPKATKKSKPKAKPKTKYILGKKDRPTDLKKRKSPPYSAKQFPKGARKKGNNGKMWTIVTDKRGVKRWKA